MIEFEPDLFGDDVPIVPLCVRCLPSEEVRLALAGVLRDIAGSTEGPIGLVDGYLVVIDRRAMPMSAVRRLPTLIAERLAAVGVDDAVIGHPALVGERHGIVPTFAPAARGWLVGSASALLGPAVDWLDVHRVPGTEPVVLVGSAEFEATWDNVHQVLAPPPASGSPAVAMSTDFGTAASVIAVAPSCLSLTAAGGLAQDPRRLIPRQRRADDQGSWSGPSTRVTVGQAMEGLRDLIRTCASTIDWGGAGVEPDARHASHAHPSAGSSTVDVWDLVVPNAMWYQVLGPGHLARLGGLPEGALSLGDGRFELTVGSPVDWLASRAAVHTRARALLAACLPDDAELAALRRRRADGQV